MAMCLIDTGLCVGVIIEENAAAVLRLRSGRRATFRTEPFQHIDGTLDVRWTFDHDRADTGEVAALQEHIVSSFPRFAATGPAGQLSGTYFFSPIVLASA